MGLSAFWIGHVDPIRWIYLQVIVVMGGVAIPIALFPAYLKKIVLALPFSNAVYGAARIIVGCSGSDRIMYVSLQLLWLVMLILITKLIFNRGVKNVVISGG
jgi:ABC-2 type transport system permease protein